MWNPYFSGNFDQLYKPKGFLSEGVHSRESWIFASVFYTAKGFLFSIASAFSSVALLSSIIHTGMHIATICQLKGNACLFFSVDLGHFPRRYEFSGSPWHVLRLLLPTSEISPGRQL